MKLTFCLIHSPLVGPTTWQPVATALTAAGGRALLPVLDDARTPGDSYAASHVASMADFVRRHCSEEALVLVGHSGAGPLLPAIGAALETPPAAYLFVDAGLPRPGASRLALIREESPAWAEEFAAFLAAGGRFPAWDEEMLRALIPDPVLRRQTVAELRPRGLDFFSEEIACPPVWSPSAYLQFSDSYAVPAQRAQAAGWPFRRMDAGHFHMLVEPVPVADALIALAVQAEAENRRG